MSAKKKKVDYTFEQMMDFLRKERDKHLEEVKFQEAIAKLDARKAEIKKKQSKLTKSVMSAKHQSPGGLDLHSDENRYYSKENTQKWLEGTSYYENYQAMRNQDDY
tara:strand:+ start:96 stop:413 length:318 start_codon:yes stop_codon:yes gene_type:complete